MDNKPKILIAEDEATTQVYFQRVLEKNYDLILVDSVEQAIEQLNAHTDISMFILDLSLPDGTGYIICQEIRMKGYYRNTPIAILTSSDREDDRVMSYNLMVDNFLSKPVSARVLESLVRSKLKSSDKSESRTIYIDGESFVFDPDKHHLIISGQVVELSPIEVKLLIALNNNKNIILNRNTILNKVWGESVAITDRVIDQHISALRKKIKSANVEIETIYGVGYKFKVAS